jgi:hypothetical protein
MKRPEITFNLRFTRDIRTAMERKTYEHKLNQAKLRFIPLPPNVVPINSLQRG